MPITVSGLFAKPAKIIAHVTDPIATEQPRAEQPVPLGPQIQLDARIPIPERIEIIPISNIQLNPRNAKKHPEKQIALLQENIEKFGFTNPLLVDEDNKLIAGHARHEAARRAGLELLRVIRVTHLTSAKKRALAIADNKIAELGEWNLDILSEELTFLFDDASVELEFDPRIIGFDTVEVDQIVEDGSSKKDRSDPADDFETPPPETPAVTATVDIWECGEHRLLCGNATDPENYAALMGRDQAEIVFTDPPYNVPNAGHVTKREDVREFAMAAGEMSSDEFTAFFLLIVFGCIFTCMQAGAVGFFCMDWRHLSELWAAADPGFGRMRNLIVWVKRNAGLGSFYRSRHEMICVYAAPGKPINNFGLGKGRHRTNVWEFPGFNGFVRNRDEMLAMHPTVKPVAMAMDALKDCSNRGGIVLDPFAGSGTTMIAAERTKRRARLMEIDPIYCDTIVQRWQKFTGLTARLAETNETFDEVKARRGAGR